MSLESLYQEIILDHYKHPRNFGEVPGCAAAAEHENPLCGDQMRVAFRLEDERIAEIKFSGKGCAISQASASMMTEAVRGCTLAAAREKVTDFLAMMRGEREFAALDETGELEALKGVLQFPVRVKCATLAWNCLAHCLDAAGKDGS
jgi:SUF system NifU family Fe-S assembly protein